MQKIVLYTTPLCSTCVRAKGLLSQKDVPFEEIDVSGKMDLRNIMVKRAGGWMTVPQIFVGATHVGGYEDLFALDRKGELDPLLDSVS